MVPRDRYHQGGNGDEVSGPAFHLPLHQAWPASSLPSLLSPPPQTKVSPSGRHTFIFFLILCPKAVTQNVLPRVLVSYGCCNKLNSVTTQIYYFIILEFRSLHWVSLGQNHIVGSAAFLPESLEENVSLPFPALVTACIPWPVAPSSIFKDSSTASSNHSL